MQRRKSATVAGTTLAAALALSACSINPAWKLAKNPPAADALLLSQVPFFPQTDYQCGPAALATVLWASGTGTTPGQLTPQIYLPGREGSLQVELIAATRRAGRVPYVLERDPEGLIEELRGGRPVLVLQNLLTRSVPRWHYAVLVGSDPARNRVILNSGPRRGLEMPAPRFLRTWDWGGRWAMLALRPGELPIRAETVAYLAAVADFEQVAGTLAAGPAYEAALRRWPQDPRVHLALGNAAYAAGEASDSLRHYREGLEFAPADPVLGNNYASVLGELGCRDEARAALQSARSGLSTAGDNWSGRLQETEAELAASAAPRDPACDRLGLP